MVTLVQSRDLNSVVMFSPSKVTLSPRLRFWSNIFGGDPPVVSIVILAHVPLACKSSPPTQKVETFVSVVWVKSVICDSVIVTLPQSVAKIVVVIFIALNTTLSVVLSS